MIPERHMKQAKRLDNGELVRGYYIHDEGLEIDFSKDEISNEFNRHCIYVNQDDVYEVDPSTVEYVAVKPNLNDGRSYCANCNDDLTGIEKYIKYCPECGQRIDWDE